MRRPPLLPLASISLFVIVAAAFFLFLEPMGSGNDLPDPPREGTRVFAGPDGWYLALPDSPVEPDRPRDIWVSSDEFDDSDALFLTTTPKGEDGPLQTFNISVYLGEPGDEWRQLIPSFPDFHIGLYDVQLIRKPGDEILVEGEWPYEIKGWIDGIVYQEWFAVPQAFRAVYALDIGASLAEISCAADPYDAITGRWTVTCDQAGIETMWTVDAQTGETEQIGEPTLLPSD